jgi:predicted peptidase
MITRREAIALLAAMPVARRFAVQKRSDDPRLAPGAPSSPERLALIEAFKKNATGLDARFERRTHTGDWAMPYRLFRPESRERLPLVLYLHGSGGLGTDNEKQLGLGNTFGTRVWALPEHQQKFPCYVLAPQTDRGWIKGDAQGRAAPGFGDGVRVALEIIDALRKEFPIDERRLYITGQSMGGGGVWNMTAHRPRTFAAAVACCGSVTLDTPADSAGTPLWNFHGDADATVPVRASRERIAALRKSGAHPIATEYAGVGHNVWEWAYTEPALVPWVVSHRRA